ncbi:unnamed protein product [Soboliphyme baturini]|uniref:RNase H domain-containing protein n=1 Tax=Soboliphyme baturini TaxID=241478 RepID=A0A183J749_9BILA|nr:unnamed protein product [Soboliphyme baturini]
MANEDRWNDAESASQQRSRYTLLAIQADREMPLYLVRKGSTRTKPRVEAYSRKLQHIRSERARLVDEGINYQLDIIGISSTRRKGSGILNHCWCKISYSGVDITKRAQADVGVQVECQRNGGNPLTEDATV